MLGAAPPRAAPHATWSKFSAARADAALDATPQPTGAMDSAATQVRLGAGLAAFERFQHVRRYRWYEVLPVAASGVTFVLAQLPLVHLGPLTREAQHGMRAWLRPGAMPDANRPC